MTENTKAGGKDALSVKGTEAPKRLQTSKPKAGAAKSPKSDTKK